MPIVTAYPTSNTAVDGTWSNPTNAYDNLGTVVSITRGTTKNSSNSRIYGTYGFDSSLPLTAIINSVTIEVSHRVATTSNICFLENQARISGTPGATNSDDTEPTTLTARSYPYSRPGGGNWTRADLLNAVFDTVLIARNGNNATSNTWQWDYIRVVVDYSLPTFGKRKILVI